MSVWIAPAGTELPRSVPPDDPAWVDLGYVVDADSIEFTSDESYADDWIDDDALSWSTSATWTLCTELLTPPCYMGTWFGFYDGLTPYIDIYPRGELIDRGQLPARCDRRAHAPA